MSTRRFFLSFFRATFFFPLVLLLLGASLTLNAFHLAEERRTLLRSVRATSQIQARLLGLQISRVLQAAELLLASTAHTLTTAKDFQGPVSAENARFIRLRGVYLRELENILIFGADGEFRHGMAAVATVPGTIREKPFFQGHRDALIRSALGGQRVGGHRLIRVSHRLETADGTFAGVGVALLDPGNLPGFADGVPGQADQFALLDSDGELLAVWPRPAGDPPARTDDLPLFRRFGEALFHGGGLKTFETQQAVLSVYQIPLFSSRMAVGYDKVRALAPWRRAVLVDAASIGGMSLLGGAALWALWRQWRRRERAETALRRSEAAYRTLVENFPAGAVCRFESDLRCSLAGGDGLESIGISRSDMLGRSLEELLPVNVVESLRPHFRRALSGHTGRLEIQVKGRFFDVHTLPMPEESRGADSGMFLIQDITERKRGEAEILRAKEAAEAADRAKSEFMANMSHELRTPMHAVLNFAWLGITRHDHLRPEQTIDYFRRIHESGTQLLVFLNDLLDFSSLAADRHQLASARCDFREAADGAILDVAEKARRRDIRIQLQEDGPLPDVAADPGRVQQVLRHILNNAITFSPAGSPVVVDFRNIPPEEGAGSSPAVEVRIADRGPGIPEAEREIIFEKFTQSSRTKSGAGGVGLGLALCRAIARVHGGHIWVEENPDGGGSRFHFRLPRAPGASARERAMDPPPFVSTERPDSSESFPADLVSPPADTIEMLYQLALIGDIFQLRDRLELLEAENSQYAPFATRLREMGEAFQLEEIQQFLTLFREAPYGDIDR